MRQKTSIWKGYEKKLKKGTADPINFIYERSRFIQPFSLFYCLYKRIPSRLAFSDINKDALLKSLIKRFGIPKDHIIQSGVHILAHDDIELGAVILMIAPNLWVYFNPGNDDMEGVELVYNCPNEKLFDQVKVEILHNVNKPADANCIYLLYRESHGGIYLKPFEINYPSIDLNLNYNDDLLPINDHIVKRLNEKNGKGILLLYGKTGGGKTSYIRNLIKVLKKKIIFLSPDVIPSLSEPGFLTLLSSHRNSILVVEDAENIIVERRGNHTSAVSNILNLTDGLLSDCFNIQLICSFNTDISRIDKALLRKGRLIAKYEFKSLKAEKAQVLSNGLGNTATIKEDMTLAEIYNIQESDSNGVERKRIGY